ncbi:hypothetical protein SELMODRAFT_405052 [Selaginella moellendorffii]|uniref:Uncharacterized protein n=1 Tax=Selaginella moellendorffii TaxID=88036 RepID=D8QY87_SELML|nr:hypothetical protein SELMODRAFT_405052 [Selaginella moellendorffii]
MASATKIKVVCRDLAKAPSTNGSAGNSEDKDDGKRKREKSGARCLVKITIKMQGSAGKPKADEADEYQAKLEILDSAKDNDDQNRESRQEKLDLLESADSANRESPQEKLETLDLESADSAEDGNLESLQEKLEAWHRLESADSAEEDNHELETSDLLESADSVEDEDDEDSESQEEPKAKDYLEDKEDLQDEPESSDCPALPDSTSIGQGRAPQQAHDHDGQFDKEIIQDLRVPAATSKDFSWQKLKGRVGIIETIRPWWKRRLGKRSSDMGFVSLKGLVTPEDVIGDESWKIRDLDLPNYWEDPVGFLTGYVSALIGYRWERGGYGDEVRKDVCYPAFNFNIPHEVRDVIGPTIRGMLNEVIRQDRTDARNNLKVLKAGKDARMIQPHEYDLFVDYPDRDVILLEGLFGLFFDVSPMPDLDMKHLGYHFSSSKRGDQQLSNKAELPHSEDAITGNSALQTGKEQKVVQQIWRSKQIQEPQKDSKGIVAVRV